MALKKKIRNLIVGEDKYIESWARYKQVMLSGQFAIMGILFLSFYFLFDVIVGTYATLPVYATAIFFLGLSIFIHRQGDHGMANYLLLPNINIVVYLIASSESLGTGTF